MQERRARTRTKRWGLVVAGYATAFFAGVGFAKWLRTWGDWHDGLAWERAMLRAWHVDLPGWLDSVMLLMPWLGTNITLLPITVGIVAWLALRHRRYQEAVYLAVVQIGSNTLNPAVKFIYERERPNIIPRRGWYDWAAYPSGHAIASTAVLVTMAIVLYRVKGWKWPAYAVVPLLLVSLVSRVYLGVHWPTDVIGGTLMGSIWLATTYYAFRGEPTRGEPTKVF